MLCNNDALLRFRFGGRDGQVQRRAPQFHAARVPGRVDATPVGLKS